VAQPGPNHRAGHPPLGGVHGSGERNHSASLAFKPAFLLIETAMGSLQPGMRRRIGLGRAQRRERKRCYRHYGEDGKIESGGTVHGNL
jgi:hypothetical protein